MHSCTPKKDVSLAKKIKKDLSKDGRKHGVIDQVKYRKNSTRKWIDREYYVQDNSDVSHKGVTTYCDTNQFPTLMFCGSHPKPHGARGWVSIIIYVLIPNSIMAYVPFAAYHFPVLHVHRCLTNHAFPVLSQQNRHATNL